MKFLLAASLMLVSAFAFAEQVSAPNSRIEAAAEAASDRQVEREAAAAAKSEAADEKEDKEERPFKPPAGYKAKRVNGEQVWCAKVQVLGTKFPKEDCRTEAQLRDMERTNRAMRDALGRGRSCSGEGCVFN